MTASRYHLNRRGEAKQCRARVKPCPLGLTAEEHYPTREAAEAAYEASMAKLAPAAALSKKEPQEEGGALDPWARLWARPEEVAARIDEVLSQGVVIREEAGDGSLEAEGLPPGYRALAMGTHRLALLDEETGLVYKLPLNSLPPEEFAALVRAEQESLAVTEEKVFAGEERVRYAKTYFHTSSSGVPVVVQEYLSPTRFLVWGTHDYRHAVGRAKADEVDSAMADFRKRNASEGGQPGLADMFPFNVYYDKQEDKVVLIDCLNAPYSFWKHSALRSVYNEEKKVVEYPLSWPPQEEEVL